MQLDGVRVLDLTRLLPGPYATQLLADAGADVVKIEDVSSGDYGRDIGPFTDRDTGAIFDLVNRGKRSVALDLKSEYGRETFYTLVTDADVVFEQFRPGVVDRLNVDYETVRQYNEEIIYCSLSGYGQTGPFADRAGHDLNYIGLAGLLDMSRDDPQAQPQIPGYQIGDLGGGLFAAFAIVSSLLSRELGNTSGEYIDVSMTDVVLSFSQSVAYQALSGDKPRPGETPLTGAFPWYDVYECADGRYITLAPLEAKFWRTFCEEVGRDDLIDKHNSRDPSVLQAVREELSELFAQKPRETWMAELSDETMTAPVNTPREAVEHAQIQAREIVKRPNDAPPRIGFPALGSDVFDHNHEWVAEHGEHTTEVLQNAGISDKEISALRDREIIK